jgi:hypothetical protein
MYVKNNDTTEKNQMSDDNENYGLIITASVHLFWSILVLALCDSGPELIH